MAGLPGRCESAATLIARRSVWPSASRATVIARCDAGATYRRCGDARRGRGACSPVARRGRAWGEVAWDEAGDAGVISPFRLF